MIDLPTNLIDWFPPADLALLPWEPTFTQYGSCDHAWVVRLETVSLCRVTGLDGWVACADVLVTRLVNTEIGVLPYQQERLTLTPLDFETDEQLGSREAWEARLKGRLARERFLCPEPVWEAAPDLLVRGDFSRERMAA